MRGTLDPKRMYKRPGKFAIPEFSHVGRVVEGPTEFFSGRLTNRERRRTLVDEALEAEAASGKLGKRYRDVQLKQRSGKKAFYRNLKARRHRNK
jgi:Fcf2 pre-rRNA processing